MRTRFEPRLSGEFSIMSTITSTTVTRSLVAIFIGWFFKMFVKRRSR